MRTYKIVTRNVVYETWYIDAESAEYARDNYYDGNLDNSETTDTEREDMWVQDGDGDFVDIEYDGNGDEITGDEEDEDDGEVDAGPRECPTCQMTGYLTDTGRCLNCETHRAQETQLNQDTINSGPA